jgi:uncharacterized protein (TIRG00374 family)
LAKWTLGILLIGLFVWLNWDKLEQAPATLAAAHWGPFGIAILVYLTGVFLTFYRWYLLVRAQNLPFRPVDAIRLGFIGNLFSIALPGSVGGDLIKAGYLAREQERRTVAIATIVVDRLLGLYGLILAAALLGGLYWQQAWDLPVLRVILVFIWSLAAGGAVGIVLVLALSSESMIARLSRVPKVGRVLSEVVRAAHTYRHKHMVLAMALLLSILGHVGFVLTYYFACQAVAGPTPSLTEHYLIVPVGMVAQSVPLTPGNLGFSEHAFRQLYEWLPSQSDKGWDTAMLQRLATWVVAVIGLFFYIPLRGTVRQILANRPPEPSTNGQPVARPPAVEASS